MDLSKINFNKSQLEVEYDFKYIVYEEKETLTNDLLINDITSDSSIDFLNNTTKKYVEIKVSIESNNIVSSSYSKTRTSLIDTPLRRLPRSIDKSYSNINREYYDSINNKSLDESEIENFILINYLDNNLMYLIEDIDRKELENLIKFFNVDNNNNIGLIDKLSKSKNSYISKEYHNKLKKIKNKSLLYTKRLSDNIDLYEKLFGKSNKKLSSFKKLGLLSEELTNSYTFSEDNIKERVFIGLLVKKFYKESSDYKETDCKFYFNDNFTESTFNKVIRDDAVKYGKSYIYVIYPVYQMSIKFNTTESYKNTFLFCGIPSISEEIVCKENLRPPPPVGLDGSYNKNSKRFRLTWDLPVNDQEDIKGFQIYKRHSIEEPFKLVVQLESHSINDFYERNENISDEQIIKKENTLFLDYEDSNFDTSKVNIYAICSLDAHGLVSNYSEQIGYLYDFLKNETIPDLISYSGAPLFYPNLMIPRKTIFIDNDEKLSTITPVLNNKKKFTLIATPDCFSYKKSTNSEQEDLYKSGEEDFYTFSLFRSNNRSIFKDKLKIVNYDQ